MVDSPHTGPVMKSCDIFSVVGLNRLLSKWSSHQWFEVWWDLCDITVLVGKCWPISPLIVIHEPCIWLTFLGPEKLMVSALVHHCFTSWFVVDSLLWSLTLFKINHQHNFHYQFCFKDINISSKTPSQMSQLVSSLCHIYASVRWVRIRSSDNDSTGFWPPGSLHTLGADRHI